MTVRKLISLLFFAGVLSLTGCASAGVSSPAPANTPIPIATTTPTNPPEPTNIAVPTNTTVPTKLPAPTKTLAPTPTLEPTFTVKEQALNLAGTGVNANADWAPYTEEINGVLMALVPAGCFQMGSTDEQLAYAVELFKEGKTYGESAASVSWFADEQPQHKICFDQPFWIDVTEVTNAQFTTFGGESMYPSHWTDADRPREQINWTEADAFCQKRGCRPRRNGNMRPVAQMGLFSHGAILGIANWPSGTWRTRRKTLPWAVSQEECPGLEPMT